MSIKSTLIHYDSYEYAASFTYAADAKNTQYRKGPEGTEVKPATSVDPQITWDKFVIIKDAKMFWSHGQVYKFYSLEDMYEQLAAALAEAKTYTDEEIRKAIADISIGDAQIEKIVEESVKQANTYTDKSITAMASSLGSVRTLSSAEYQKLREEGATQPMFYAVYRYGSLYRMYFDKDLFARKADDGEQASVVAFPFVFPLVFP